MSDVGVTLARFTRAERWVHRSTAVLMGTCLLTAFVLYYGPVSLLVGHRHAVELVHVVAGYALPVPMLLGLGSAAYRADLGVLNRFTRDDWQWLRSRNRRDGSFAVGKFNAGQKLNAALVAGSMVVLVGTGTLMFWTGLVRLAWRTGATFVHDWFALGLGLLVLGHLWFAIADPEARSGMRSGRVTRRWAEKEHPAWVAGLIRSREDGRAGASGTGRGRARRR
ncbi:MAG TPA: cytochrome b/b6 domain-containing protein [Nocardioides sp.]|uniref:cytochrome b/b6 domain-containing protein n=1 Tax=Nocardioides sp. TaxID=35761 RepID=UPI002E31A2B9|nr:cytochrome b/b6 domain-containing protein [Nocardioides sp.]HEX5089783.1 cytochrome b/b6 domain-containing protein [Nocardioides sp.]